MAIEWFLHNYPNCPLLAYIMRQRFPWRWFRIHSLPESKRYPESDIDENIIISRHNQVAADLLGEHSDCLLVVTRYGSEELTFPYLSGTHVFSPVHQYCEDADTEPWLSWATAVTWAPHQFDSIILAVANDEECNTLLISPLHGGIYAPYDGGADLFHIDEVRLSEIKAHYQEWASQRPDGL